MVLKAYLSCLRAYSNILILLIKSCLRFSCPFLSPCRNAIRAWKLTHHKAIYNNKTTYLQEIKKLNHTVLNLDNKYIIDDLFTQPMKYTPNTSTFFASSIFLNHCTCVCFYSRRALIFKENFQGYFKDLQRHFKQFMAPVVGCDSPKTKHSDFSLENQKIRGSVQSLIRHFFNWFNLHKIFLKHVSERCKM